MPSVSWSMRAYFSSYHLWAAKYFSKLAAEIEDHYKKSSVPVFDIRHRVLVMNSISSSVAFAEAAINELFQDAVDKHHAYILPIKKEKIDILSDYWCMTELKNKSHISILDKYQLALRFCDKKPFDNSKNPYQNAELVIQLRNTLIHYKPESISPDRTCKPGKQIKLGDKLNGKFPQNSLMIKSGNPYFPDKLLGCGCTSWSWKSMESLADLFFQSIGIEPNYKKVDLSNINN